MNNALIPRIIVIDANVLIAAISTGADAEVSRRIQYLFERVDKAKAQVIIPMPAVAEFMVKADQAGLAALEELEKQRFILLAPFDRRSAFECALLDASAINRGDKKDGSKSAWQKVKFDRQIVAIAKANGAKLIVSDDDGVQANGRRSGIDVSTTSELEQRPGVQGKLELPKT